MKITDDNLGYIKYEGKPVENGLLDARKAAKALLGFDEALRYYITEQSPELRTADYEIPVSIDKGSWIAAIPLDIGIICKISFGIAATAYLTTAANKMAEKDFADIGMKDIFKHALLGLVWSVRIAKHLGSFIQKGFDNTQFKDNGDLIGIQNYKGEYIFIPRKYFDMYIKTNPDILEKLVSNVGPDLSLIIAADENGIETKEKIHISDKYIFVSDEVEVLEEVLFPELIHNQMVNINGEVTRENKTTNSLGFKYKDHILTAYPIDGNILPYKEMLFEECEIEALVDRRDDFGHIGAKRPKLIFHNLILKKENDKLF